MFGPKIEPRDTGTKFSLTWMCYGQDVMPGINKKINLYACVTFWKVVVSKCTFLFHSRFKRPRRNRTACQRLNV